MRVDRHARRGFGGLVQPRRVGRTDIDPRAQLAGEVAHRERRLIGLVQPARERQAFGELETVGENSGDEIVLRFRGMARRFQLERLVDAAIDVRKLDSEMVDRRAERQAASLPESPAWAANIDAVSYLVGIDIGGTFTDCAIVDGAGKLLTTKVPSTPPDFARGMMDALGAGAEALGITLDRFCGEIAFLSHGTTVGTNTIIQKRGAKVGLITTKGHEDAIHIMRGSRGYGGRDIRKVVHFPETSKPAPIVPKRLIRGISERVDCFGEIVVSLNEQQAEAAINELLAQGVEAIAICFLWSFRNPTHENRVKEMVQRLAPEVFVTTSVDIAPKWGEYERVTATALNAYLGPVMGGYLQRLDQSLRGLGYSHGLQITQCGGGTVPV